MFTVTGPVIVYSLAASAVYAIIYWVVSIMRHSGSILAHIQPGWLDHPGCFGEWVQLPVGLVSMDACPECVVFRKPRIE